MYKSARNIKCTGPNSIAFSQKKILRPTVRYQKIISLPLNRYSSGAFVIIIGHAAKKQHAVSNSGEWSLSVAPLLFLLFFLLLLLLRLTWDLYACFEVNGVVGVKMIASLYQLGSDAVTQGQPLYRVLGNHL